MLACARLGAIHSVVYAGMGVGALRDRIEDAGRQGRHRRATCGMRRGKAVDLTQHRRSGHGGSGAASRHLVSTRGQALNLRPHDVDFDELMEATSRPTWIPCRWTPSTRSTSSTPPAPRANPRASSMSTAATWWAPATICAPFTMSRTTTSFGPRRTSAGWWVTATSSTRRWSKASPRSSAKVRPTFPIPGVFWACVEKYGVNVMFTAPTAVRMFMKYGPEYVGASMTFPPCA